ncbi:hypothetical protein FJ208_00615 [Candidatus Gribaldobacteria bacterium]|nr:hypothetical protein [Candidatus Gribaldobacteria bacterium]
MPETLNLSAFPSGEINQSSLQTAVSGFRDQLDFLVSQQLQDKVFWYKWSFISISILFLFLIFVILKKDNFDFFITTAGDEIKDRKSFKDLGLKQAQKQWKKIKSKFDKTNDAYFKLGLIEAEDFLDGALQRLGLGGQTIEDRINRLKEGDVPSLNQLKQAHQLCQDIVRDPDYKISKQDALANLNIFEQALTGLNVF